MPDREMVIAQPQAGMYIYYDKSHIGHWVLQVYQTAPFVCYDFVKDVRTYEAARYIPWDRWDRQRVEYDEREWKTFINRATTVRILNPEIMKPVWEV